MRKSKQYYVRKTHRYLGLFIGIQFLLWTIGGLYFSWSDIDEIHGDLQHKKPPLLRADKSFIAPTEVFQLNQLIADSIQGIQLTTILNEPFYSIRFFSAGKPEFILADAITGIKRRSFTKDEAIQIAAESFNGTPEVENVEYITSVNSHHEYRERALPAWKVTFKHNSKTNIYVSAEGGKVETLRNSKWRTFDLLWMFHTMDYKGRDNINNWILRIFSILGLITIISGYLLYWMSSKTIRRLRKPKRTLTHI